MSCDPLYTGLLSRGRYVNSFPQSSHQSSLGDSTPLNLLPNLTFGGHHCKMLIEKVYFPPPPPTFNTLTSAERAHLRRSRIKLGRVLGITPQVVDLESDTTIGEPKCQWMSTNSEVQPSQTRMSTRALLASTLAPQSSPVTDGQRIPRVPLHQLYLASIFSTMNRMGSLEADQILLLCLIHLYFALHDPLICTPYPS